jgi:hypothetical protein
MEQAVFANPNCATCHQHFTSTGFAFEHFDEAGQYRTIDNGQPVDARWRLVDLDGKSLDGDGPAALMEAIADSCVVRECHARQWIEFALARIGRKPGEADAASVREIAAALEASGGNLLDLVIAVTRSQPFLAP